MKKFLILQLRPEDETSDNEFEAFLSAGGLEREEVERHRIEHGTMPKVELEKYSAIIVGGSPYDVSTPEDEKSDSQKLVEEQFMQLFDQVVPNDFPFLGACSGNGLIGHYLGAPITKKYGEPVAWTTVSLTEKAKFDPLLIGLPDNFRVLLGHKEACEETPEKAVLLASSETCPVEMFRVGDNVYATQFHPEADPDVFEVRINIYKNHGYFPAEEAEELIARVQSERDETGKEILRRFVERYRV